MTPESGLEPRSGAMWAVAGTSLCLAGAALLVVFLWGGVRRAEPGLEREAERRPLEVCFDDASVCSTIDMAVLDEEQARAAHRADRRFAIHGAVVSIGAMVVGWGWRTASLQVVPSTSRGRVVVGTVCCSAVAVVLILVASNVAAGRNRWWSIDLGPFL